MFIRCVKYAIKGRNTEKAHTYSDPINQYRIQMVRLIIHSRRSDNKIMQ